MSKEALGKIVRVVGDILSAIGRPSPDEIARLQRIAAGQSTPEDLEGYRQGEVTALRRAQSALEFREGDYLPPTRPLFGDPLGYEEQIARIIKMPEEKLEEKMRVDAEKRLEAIRKDPRA